MYVAVKGGEKAIDNAHRLLARKRRGDTALPELSVEQIRQQMPLAVSRVMTEGSLYDEQLAALAGSMFFLRRVYLPKRSLRPPVCRITVLPLPPDSSISL